MTNPQNFEPRLSQAETSIEGLQQRTSELLSAISTLAEIVSSHESQIEANEQRFNQFLRQAEADRAEARADREQAAADRALMLRLIQAIAQGGNGSSEV